MKTAGRHPGFREWRWGIFGVRRWSPLDVYPDLKFNWWQWVGLGITVSGVYSLRWLLLHDRLTQQTIGAGFTDLVFWATFLVTCAGWSLLAWFTHQPKPS